MSFCISDIDIPYSNEYKESVKLFFICNAIGRYVSTFVI